VTRHTKGIFETKTTIVRRKYETKSETFTNWYCFSPFSIQIFFKYLITLFPRLTLVECKMHIPSNYISCFPLAQKKKKHHLFASIALV